MSYEMKRYKAEGKKEKVLSERIRNRVRKIDASSEIILYGSRARGDAGPESDYDLLILSDLPVTLNREDAIRRELFPLELEYEAVLTVILVNRKDWNSKLYKAMPFYQNVQRDGAIL